MIRDAVLHIINEQPLLADLLNPPSATDTVLTCTNLRALSGKRPIWIDDSASIFYFPIELIRFVEIHPGSEAYVGLPGGREERDEANEPPAAPPPPEPESELEIDEDFLRRVREA